MLLDSMFFPGVYNVNCNFYLLTDCLQFSVYILQLEMLCTRPVVSVICLFFPLIKYIDDSESCTIIRVDPTDNLISTWEKIGIQ